MPIKGGGGSSLRKSIWGKANGPINTIFKGRMIVDTARFQAMGESAPVVRRESGACGKPRGPVEPKRVVVKARKAKPEMMKRRMNFGREGMGVVKVGQAKRQMN